MKTNNERQGDRKRKKKLIYNLIKSKWKQMGSFPNN